jgi:hypothetical protein
MPTATMPTPSHHESRQGQDDRKDDPRDDRPHGHLSADRKVLHETAGAPTGRRVASAEQKDLQGCVDEYRHNHETDPDYPDLREFVSTLVDGRHDKKNTSDNPRKRPAKAPANPPCRESSRFIPEGRERSAALRTGAHRPQRTQRIAAGATPSFEFPSLGHCLNVQAGLRSVAGHTSVLRFHFHALTCRQLDPPQWHPPQPAGTPLTQPTRRCVLATRGGTRNCLAGDRAWRDARPDSASATAYSETSSEP